MLIIYKNILLLLLAFLASCNAGNKPEVPVIEPTASFTSPSEEIPTKDANEQNKPNTEPQTASQKVRLPENYDISQDQVDPHDYALLTLYCGDQNLSPSYMAASNEKISAKLTLPYQAERDGFIKTDTSKVVPGWNLLTIDVLTDGVWRKSQYKTWYYFPEKEDPTGDNIGNDLMVFDWKNKERVYHGLSPLIWDDDLYLVAKYRAWQEVMAMSSGTPASHKRKITPENLSGRSEFAVNAFVEKEICPGWSSASHRKNLMNSDYCYGAIAEHSVMVDGIYYNICIYVYETDGWQARLSEKIASIRNQYGDYFEVRP